MSKDIDAGDIIAKKVFAKPKILNIDFVYDCHIRSELLVDVIRQYIENGKFDSRPQNMNKGETYFIIHPILKHLAILSCIK
jgi:methionyl-tRNA formyltransferase